MPIVDTSSWNVICDVSALEPLWGEAALVDGDQVAVFRLPDERIFVVSNTDPATGASVMSRGIVGSRGERATIASPLHKDVFDLETGRCFTRPEHSLPTWRCRVVAGRLEVSRRPVLIAASHGTNDEAGQRAIRALVDAVRDARPELSVIDSFVDVQTPDALSALEGLPARTPAVVVPLLLSAGYHVHVDLARTAEQARPARSVDISAALGPDRRLASVLARRLNEAGLAGDDHVVLAAAGSSNAAAVIDCRQMGRLLAEQIGRKVTVSFISAAEPRVPAAVRTVRASHRGARVVVASYLLAPGYFADLAAESGADVTSAPLLAAGEAPPSELVDIVIERYERVATG
ncbi:MAG: nitrite reductase small subunit [Subtercola sp.]|nr:nitrite reductase small subunit [Subtercola sp.]